MSERTVTVAAETRTATTETMTNGVPPGGYDGDYSAPYEGQAPDERGVVLPCADQSEAVESASRTLTTSASARTVTV